MIGSLALMFASGILLFLSEATKCYYSFPFWIKMSSLLLAILFTFTIKSCVIRKKLDQKHCNAGESNRARLHGIVVRRGAGADDGSDFLESATESRSDPYIKFRV